MAAIPTYFTKGDMTEEKREWLERQANGLKESIEQAIRRIRIEKRHISNSMEERRRILEILRGGES